MDIDDTGNVISRGGYSLLGGGVRDLFLHHGIVYGVVNSRLAIVSESGFTYLTGTLDGRVAQCLMNDLGQGILLICGERLIHNESNSTLSGSLAT